MSNGGSGDDVEIIKPSNRLKNKVGGGGNAKFSAKVIERTEKAVASRGEDYLAKVREDIQQLRELVKKAAGGEVTPALIQEIAMTAREVKGEAATFNFPLLSHFGDGLFKFTDGMSDLSTKRLAVVQAHVDAMSAVLSHNMRGEGGPVGQQLKKGLDIAIEKFKQD
ncbi:MAG: hypothetical protein KI792_01535 [Alphaproteobacteria bacterium]|nr:hypothetical protein [Alphaproteobacteria bacterium SS10]